MNKNKISHMPSGKVNKISVKLGSNWFHKLLLL